MTLDSQQTNGQNKRGGPNQSKEVIEQRLDELKHRYGNWAYDIPLPYGIWTGGNRQKPHTRLKRILQMANDLSGKPLSACRVLDLGCLDGMFSIEFALQGAATIGVEIREEHIQKALFCKDVLGLENLEFRQDDVRNVSLESYGKFDVIICSGILYHLPAPDAIELIRKMSAMSTRMVIIDTHISLFPEDEIRFEDHSYWGDTYREHADGDSMEEKVKRLWASIDNETSFWFTRPSLINMLSKAGFSSVYECFVPPTFIPSMNFQYAGIRAHDRCTFVAIKDQDCELHTSPTANNLRQEWPEHSLSYGAPMLTPRPVEQDKQMEQLSRQHAEIVNSKAWQFVLLLRKLRIGLFPPGSTRERLVRFLLRPAGKLLRRRSQER